MTLNFFNPKQKYHNNLLPTKIFDASNQSVRSTNDDKFTREAKLYFTYSNNEHSKLIILIVVLTLILIVSLASFLFFCIVKRFNWFKNGESANSTKGNTYGTLNDNEKPTNQSNQANKPLNSSSSWPNSLFSFKKILNQSNDEKTRLTNDEEADTKSLHQQLNEDSKLRQFSMSSLSSSATSHNPTNAYLLKMISNESLINSSSPMSTSQIPSNTILNYSLNLTDQLLKINVLSLENVGLNQTLSSVSQDLNVYIRIEVLIDSNSNNKLMAKTRSIKNRHSPIYEESFDFLNTFSKQTDHQEVKIIFYVINSNLFGRDQLIGQTEHVLSATNGFSDNDVSIYSKRVDLVEAKPNDLNLGIIHMSLIYNNLTKTLKLHLMKGEDLRLPKIYLNNEIKKTNPFVKIYLLYKGQRLEKKQSKQHENTNSPEFDEIFEFNLKSLFQMGHHISMENPAFDLVNEMASSKHSTDHEYSFVKEETTEQEDAKIAANIQLVLLVMDYDQLEKNDMIGIVDLNSQHYQERLLMRQIKSTITSGVTPTIEETSLDDRLSSNIISAKNNIKQNWYDVFYEPNKPIFCSFQIKSFN